MPRIPRHKTTEPSLCLHSQMAQVMLINGGVLQSGGVIPKVTYLKNIIYSDGIIVNGK